MEDEQQYVLYIDCKKWPFQLRSIQSPAHCVPEESYTGIRKHIGFVDMGNIFCAQAGKKVNAARWRDMVDAGSAGSWMWGKDTSVTFCASPDDSYTDSYTLQDDINATASPCR